MIHIVHIIPTLRFGGAERCLVDLVNHSDEKRFRHTCIVLSDSIPLAKEITAATGTVRVIQKKGKLSIHLFGDIRKALQELRPDIVHTHLFSPDFWGRVVAHRLGIPVVTTEHAMGLEKGFLRQWIKKRLALYSRVYIAPSRAIATFLHERYSIPPTRIQVIRHGIALDRFTSVPASFGTSPIKFLILARLTPEKGHVIALDALARSADLPWTLHIVGEGSLKNDVISFVKKKGLDQRVHVSPPTPDVASIFQTADIVLVPSLKEGLGIVVMEAMAAGKLVIGSHVGGIPELVESEKTGFLVEPGNAEAMAERIRWCFSHPDMCEAIAKNARAFAKQHFGIQTMVQKYEEIYTANS